MYSFLMGCAKCPIAGEEPASWSTPTNKTLNSDVLGRWTMLETTLLYTAII